MSIWSIFIIIICFLFIIYFLYAYIKRKVDFNRSINATFLKILIPKKESDLDEKKETIKDFKEQISLMEQLLVSFKSIYSWSLKSKILWQDFISLEYVAIAKEIYFFIVVPKKARILAEKLITSFYPDAIVDEVEEINIFKNKKIVKCANLVLDKPFNLPIKTYQKLESDPINNITNALSKLSQNEISTIQILLVPIKDSWQKKVNKINEQFKKWFSFSINPLNWIVSILEFLSTSKDDKDNKSNKDEQDNDTDSLKKDKWKKTGYDVIIRIICTWDDEHVAEAQLKNIISSFTQFSSPDNNRFTKAEYINSNFLIHNYIFRYFRRAFFRKQNILNIEEIASIFHFPHAKYNKTPEIKWQGYKVTKAPTNIPKDWIFLWHNIYRWVKTEIRVAKQDRFRHLYVIWQTGTWKSCSLEVMIRQDLKAWEWICVMDPHWDLADGTLPYVPRDRADDVIYFNPADTSRPLWINLLEADWDEEKDRVTQDAMNIMLKLFWNEIFGPRIQDYFRNWVLTLMDYPGGWAITDLIRLFTDDDFQKERVNTCKNSIVKSWWNYTFAKMWDREKWEMIPFWAAKFGWFVTNTMMRNIIWQVKSSFDISDCMQTGKILLINLSKWVLWDVNSNLLWLIIVSKIQMAAMRRQLIDKSERKDFFLYIDEFQNYITDSIESVLSEARKYRLGLIIAHQYLWQLQKSDALTKSNTNLKDAIFGNVWSVLSLKTWPEDAEFMAKQFAPVFSEQDLINLDAFKWIMKLSINDQASSAFSVSTLKPWIEDEDTLTLFWKPNKKLAKAYKELSRLKYGRDVEFVNKEILFRIWGA